MSTIEEGLSNPIGVDNNGKKLVTVVTLDTGKYLGKVNRVAINTQTKKVVGISYRNHFAGEEFFLNMEQIDRIGEDVIFIKSGRIHPNTIETSLPGEDLREFQGTWVYSNSDQPVGALTDIGFSPANWKINKLYLNDNKVVKVVAENIFFSHERIVIPDIAVSRIATSKELEGLLAGLFGSSVVKQASIILQRTLRGIPIGPVLT